ncbi:sex determination protein fruitless-like [Diachasmimorpha longicaudata]|uniref:sex determination protein fruitless-like n=1 Tax=Diachasmimorpha longicaudata TaxID=58733 RepID=UPI0030B8D027
MRKKNGENEKCVPWSISGFGFAGSISSRPGGLSYHDMFTVSLDAPVGTRWRCRACGIQVTNRWHHFHVHTGQRSLCPYCPATYSRVDTLRSHLRAKHRELLVAKGILQGMAVLGHRRRRQHAVIRPTMLH